MSLEKTVNNRSGAMRGLIEKSFSPIMTLLFLTISMPAPVVYNQGNIKSSKSRE